MSSSAAEIFRLSQVPRTRRGTFNPEKEVSFPRLLRRESHFADLYSLLGVTNTQTLARMMLVMLEMRRMGGKAKN